METMYKVKVKVENFQGTVLNFRGKDIYLAHDSIIDVPEEMFTQNQRFFTFINAVSIPEESPTPKFTPKSEDLVLVDEWTDEDIMQEEELGHEVTEQDMIEFPEDMIEFPEDVDEDYENMHYQDLQKLVFALGKKAIGVRKKELIKILKNNR